MGRHYRFDADAAGSRRLGGSSVLVALAPAFFARGGQIERIACMNTPTDLSTLPEDIDLRLVAVDMDGTLLDDGKNFLRPSTLCSTPSMIGGRLRPSSGRQVWTRSTCSPDGRE